MNKLIQVEKPGKNRHVTIAVDGLTCGGSDPAILERTLSKVAGVIHVYVNPCTEMAYLEFDPTLANPYLLLAAINKAGYKADEFCLR